MYSIFMQITYVYYVMIYRVYFLLPTYWLKSFRLPPDMCEDYLKYNIRVI